MPTVDIVFSITLWNFLIVLMVLMFGSFISALLYYNSPKRKYKSNEKWLAYSSRWARRFFIAMLKFIRNLFSPSKKRIRAKLAIKLDAHGSAKWKLNFLLAIRITAEEEDSLYLGLEEKRSVSPKGQKRRSLTRTKRTKPTI